MREELLGILESMRGTDTWLDLEFAQAGQAELVAVGFIKLRPTYCDRGRYHWDVESRNRKVFFLDAVDMFPRLYFLPESLASEMYAWLRARGLRLMTVYKRRLDIRLPNATETQLTWHFGVESAVA